MQLGSVKSVFLPPVTGIPGDAERHHPVKKQRGEDVAAEVPMVAYLSAVIAHREEAFLRRGLLEKGEGSVPELRMHPIKDRHPELGMHPIKNRHPELGMHAIKNRLSEAPDKAAVLTPTVRTGSGRPEPVTPAEVKCAVPDALNLAVAAEPVSAAQDAAAAPQHRLQGDIQREQSSGAREGVTETHDERRRPDVLTLMHSRLMTGGHDISKTGDKNAVAAESTALRAMRSLEMMQRTPETTDPLASGETRISWTFRRWQPSGEQAVRISVMPDAASQMIMTPSTRDVGERLDVARHMAGSPDFVLRDERGQDQGRHRERHELPEEDEA